jgi:hypothetical protein
MCPFFRADLFMILLLFGGMLCFVAYGVDQSDPTNLYLGVVLVLVVVISGGCCACRACNGCRARLACHACCASCAFRAHVIAPGGCCAAASSCPPQALPCPPALLPLLRLSCLTSQLHSPLPLMPLPAPPCLPRAPCSHLWVLDRGQGRGSDGGLQEAGAQKVQGAA